MGSFVCLFVYLFICLFVWGKRCGEVYEGASCYVRRGNERMNERRTDGKMRCIHRRENNLFGS